MKIVLDESVSFGLAEVLKRARHTVITIAGTSTSGITDDEIFKITVKNDAVLITRDYHFTNSLRFPPNKTSGILYIRHGNLTANEEIKLVQRFLSIHPYEEYSGRLVTLYKGSVKIR